jgi:hypothetical protein
MSLIVKWHPSVYSPRVPLGRPEKLLPATTVHIRFPTEILADLDAWVEELPTRHPGMSSISRSDLIRDLTMKAVEDRKAAGRKGPKR